MTLSSAAAICRPSHWLKNVFVILPLVFSFSFLDPVKIFQSAAAFLLFSLASSGIYIINDLRDIPYDRRHSVKKRRPLAAGSVSPREAVIIAGGLLLFSLLFSYLFSPAFFAAVSAYAVLNVFYSLYLKNIALLDLISVAFSLVLRVVAGILAISAEFSPWILGTTFFLGLVIISMKRLGELTAGGHEVEHRPVLAFYSSAFLNEIILVSITVSLSLFLLYAFLKVKSNTFLLLVLPATFGLFRLKWLLSENKLTSDNPVDIIYRDRPLQIVIAVFAVLLLIMLTLPFTSFSHLFLPFAE